MVLVEDSRFLTLVRRTNSQYDEVPQQHQIKSDDCSRGLIIFVWHMNPYKLSWYPIRRRWKDGNPSMVLPDNTG